MSEHDWIKQAHVVGVDDTCSRTGHPHKYWPQGSCQYCGEVAPALAEVTKERDEAVCEIGRLKAGIKRLSDEEERLAETTDGEEFSLVSLAAQLASVESVNKRLRELLKKIEWWAQQRCPCHEETPNPCPLCGASVENLEACKAVESIFPRDLLSEVRSALLHHPDTGAEMESAR
ncbi:MULTISPECIES: hypothetical protein [unclassified Sinorhizobium]|uniref:hypothetical protein n=1 Tax=unclassified Sinorhizobium TaxID=2613772 RepID=UPI003525C9BB